MTTTNAVPAREPFMFNGMRVVASMAMVEPGQPVTTRRTWRERLFSRPWRPMRATKTHIPMVPMKNVVVSNGTIFAHPEVVRRICQAIDQAGTTTTSKETAE